MKLAELFKAQKELDAEINEKKGIGSTGNFDWKTLALLTEIGECANEWRGFKVWSEDREPRKFVPNPDDKCASCDGTGLSKPELGFEEQPFCHGCDGCGVHFHNPLLEEYVDCLHFILSIGVELQELGYEIYGKEGYFADYVNFNIGSRSKKTDPLKQFTYLFRSVTLFDSKRNDITYESIVSDFMTLGDALGFAEQQVEDAYYEKNKTNHERQHNGY